MAAEPQDRLAAVSKAITENLEGQQWTDMPDRDREWIDVEELAEAVIQAYDEWRANGGV